MEPVIKSPEKLLIKEIERVVSTDPGNRCSRLNGAPYFEHPLVGFADARDPLFETFKSIIGGFHLTPLEVLDRSFPGQGEGWEGASVISWILPIAHHVRESNRRETRHPSEAWLLAKSCGEEFNIKLAEHLASFLTELGFCAVVPTLAPFFEMVTTGQTGFAANWSERHVAYVAGLGTFGLNGALITKHGVAMRCGSVVTNLQLKPTKRQYGDFREFCLFYSTGGCGRCMERCPGAAISREGHHHERCMMYSATAVQELEGDQGGMPGCGLCQTNVPCEDRIPGNREKEGNVSA